MYSRTSTDPLKEKITSHLNDFQNSDSYIGGYDIMRWTKNGLIRAKESVDSNVFLEWYPHDVGYVILRLAKEGLLEYRCQT